MKHTSEDSAFQRVTPKQAAIELNMDVESVRYLMRENRLPIGSVMKKKGARRCTYYIYRGALDAEKERILNGKCKW